ncbi:PREDICTED: uncharacterized protein LOC109582079 [Amphimedon queenslandica]|uniref:SOCS box domain-containing protein n=1 Tax=Amphimedon queenslandica TaxID=400682 RepID=A0A1X7UTU9_AMPQE|nr:PREDICTED: uncharacterized protein LOC109582079 [Amphimedon queenslandica]|eukprot:XP_019852231.1 PREDICTED: uncharacterized protein LOC109582079 [Amphimedon queenslandica]
MAMMASPKLHSHIRWERYNHAPKSIPSNAVVGGKTEKGVNIYIGRDLWKRDVCSIPATKTSSRYAVFTSDSASVEILVCDNHSILFWADKGDDRIRKFGIGPMGEIHYEPYERRHGYLIGRTVPNQKTHFNWPRPKVKLPRDVCLLGHLDLSSLQLSVPNKTELYYSSTTDSYQVLCAYRVPIPVYSFTKTWKWVPASNGYLPPGAVPGGKDESGEVIYIARAFHENEVPAGYVSPSQKCCIYPWGCTTHQTSNYEVLVVEDQNNLKWERASDGDLPVGAVTSNEEGEQETGVGRTLTDSDLSIGITFDGIRINIPQRTSKDMQLLGKIPIYHRCLYIPYKNKEFIYREYEALKSLFCANSLQKLCSYVILESVHAVPDRINSLPLPKKMKDSLLTLIRYQLSD